MSDELFPSGPWIGFYTYRGRTDRHRMDLAMEFVKGTITGEGTDGIGPFVIRGRFNPESRQCHWTKTYVAAHDVFYQGVRQGRGIWGTWQIPNETKGGFRIWPLAQGAGDEEEETVEKAEPVEAVGVVAGSSTS